MNSSPSKVTQTTEQKLSPEQKELVQGGMTLARPTINNPPTMPDIPGFNAEQMYAQNAITSSALPGGALKGLTDAGTANQNFLLKDVLDVNNNQGLQGAISASLRPLEEQFTRVVKPGINHEAIGTGAFTSYGGTKNIQANNLADNAYMRQISDTTNDLVNRTYTANLDAMVKGQAMQGQAQRNALFPETAISAVGDTKRGLEMQQAQQGFENELLPFNLALQLLGAAGATPGGGSTGTVTGAQPQSNPLQTLFGSALSAMAFL